MNKLCLILVMLGVMIACKQTDPSLTHIPKTDSTNPTLEWVLDIETAGAQGPVKATQTFKETNNIVSIKRTDKVHLYLLSNDNESGIVYSELKGEFDYLCIDPNVPEKGANSHGSIPGNYIAFDEMKIQAHKSWKLDGYRLLNNFSCDGEYTYSRGKFVLEGEAINHLKDTGKSNLVIQVLP